MGSVGHWLGGEQALILAPDKVLEVLSFIQT
jgi:hypothetical protein